MKCMCKKMKMMKEMCKSKGKEECMKMMCAKAEECFKKADKNEDGFLDLDEFAGMCKEMIEKKECVPLTDE